MRDLNNTVPSLDPSLDPSFVRDSGVVNFGVAHGSIPVADTDTTDSRTLCESSLTKS